MQSLAPLFLLFLLLINASAQDEAQVRAKIDLIAWGNKIPGLTLKNPSGETSAAFSFEYNKSLTYVGPQILAIYQLETKEEQPPIEDDDDYNDGYEEEPAPPQPAEDLVDIKNIKDPLIKSLFERKIKEPNLVSLVKLPTNSRHLTILLAPASGGTFLPYVIDDDPSKLPFGKLRVHNLTNIPILLEQLNGPQRCELRANEKFLLNADDANKFTYKLSYKKGDRWKAQQNNILRIPANSQNQFIVLQSNNQYFRSSDGSKGGFLQVVLLKRKAS